MVDHIEETEEKLEEFLQRAQICFLLQLMILYTDNLKSPQSRRSMFLTETTRVACVLSHTQQACSKYSHVCEHTGNKPFPCCPGSKCRWQENPGPSEIRKKACVGSGSLGDFGYSEFQCSRANPHCLCTPICCSSPAHNPELRGERQERSWIKHHTGTFC